ncbi:DUF2974 domain-containing protein [Paenibacillus sp. TRM 82003]|nr:DUF2974 domain-containing protein [Paenibacillus sp. TRM 82003]
MSTREWLRRFQAFEITLGRRKVGEPMANMMDYLDWRGDLPMTHSLFNEVDHLIFAQLAYVDFEEIVPPSESDETITIREASERYFSKHEEAEVLRRGPLIRNSASLLKRLAECARFAQAKLGKYVNVVSDNEQKQFSAIHAELDDGTVYVAYRGTDLSIVGWKENFNMSFTTPVPAQLEAVRYLEQTAQGAGTPLRLGGHSKGGNLAVYAAVRCDPSIQSRIIEVYNNDGPGFDAEMTRSEAYRSMLPRIRTIVPQSSVVGMLLEHVGDYTVVKSSQTGFAQHAAMSWEVLGKQFVRVGHVAKESQLLAATLKAWLYTTEPTQREQFVDAMFYVFGAANIRSFTDLSQNKWKKTSEMIKALNHMSPENKDVLNKTFRLLFSEGRRVFLEARAAKKKPSAST